MAIKQKIKSNVVNILRKTAPLKKFNSLINYLRQLGNNQALIKQMIEYEAQEIKNHSSIESLSMRAMVSSYLEKKDHKLSLAKSNYQKANPKPYQMYLNKLQEINPEIFNEWEKCFKHGEISYFEEREHSCSTRNNVYVRGFKEFIAIHAQGRLLDQGCGIYGLPYYLEGYPLELISAIEPLEPVIDGKFEIVRGFSEELPWPDESFGTIVNGTSLDHVLCLQTALDETHRVLQTGGQFLVWIASIAGAKPLDMNKRPVVPIDKFHLFHFNETWFEEMMADRFRIKDKLVYPTPSFDHIFYSFEKLG